jgi:manganese/iron transport system permease protein/iron/zinc/copper transport system permease protein
MGGVVFLFVAGGHEERAPELGFIGGLGSVAAFFLSYPLGWSVSATIIVVLGGLFMLAYIFSPRYGLFSARRR